MLSIPYLFALSDLGCIVNTNIADAYLQYKIHILYSILFQKYWKYMYFVFGIASTVPKLESIVYLYCQYFFSKEYYIIFTRIVLQITILFKKYLSKYICYVTLQDVSLW